MGRKPLALPPIVEEFKNRISGLKSDFTVKGYVEAARRFVEYVGEKPSYGPEDIARYMAHLARIGLSHNTRVFHFYALKCFYDVMGFDIGRIRPPRPVMPRPHVWSYEDIRLILDAVDRCGNAMERALLWLAAWTGARRVQLLNLLVRDYDPVSHVLHIPRTQKGDMDRAVVLPEEVRERFEPWWRMRLKNAGPNARLFPITNRTADNILTRYAKMAGVYTTGSGFHSIRRGLCTELYKAGLGIRELQDALGWSTPTMPMRYVHLLSQDVVEEFREAHPLLSGTRRGGTRWRR